MDTVATDSKWCSSYASMRFGNGLAMLHSNADDMALGQLVTSFIILVIALTALPNAIFRDHKSFWQILRWHLQPPEQSKHSKTPSIQFQAIDMASPPPLHLSSPLAVRAQVGFKQFRLNFMAYLLFVDWLKRAIY